MRLRIHDEARFLADQAIHPGFIQAQGLRGRMHDVVVRRRVALRIVHFQARAVGRIDHAVEHIVLARKFRGRQMLAIRHRTQFPVPLARAFEAQAHVEKFQRPLQARIGGHGGDFCRADGLARRRQHQMVAQLFVGQQAIEIRLFADRTIQGVGLRIRAARRFRLLRARQPVDPGGVRAQRGRHGLDGRLHHRPVAFAQGNARFPLHLLLGQRCAIGFLPIFKRFRRQRIRCLQCQAGPADGLLLRGQLRAGFLQGHHAQFQGAFRHAADSHQVHFMVGAAGARALGQHQRRQIDRLRHLRVGRTQQQRDAARRARGVGLARQADLRPQLIRVELAILRQDRDQAAARFAIAGRRDQQVARFGRHVLPLGRARHQRIALELGVVVEGELRILLVEYDPVALAAQFQQPVVAETVGDGAALVAVQVIAKLRLGQQFDARFQPIIVNIRWNLVIRQAPRIKVGFFGVILARGVAQQQEGIVLAARVGCGRRDGGGHLGQGGQGRQGRCNTQHRAGNPFQWGNQCTTLNLNLMVI